MPHRNPRDRTNVIEWAQKMLNDNAIILDFETTGFKDAEIVQIGMIDSNGDTLMSTLVKPQERIPAAATKVHGITDDAVKDAPGFPEVFIDFSVAMAGRTVVAYNVSFEQGILKSVCQRHGLAQPRPKGWTCAMRNYAKFYGQWNPRRNSYTWQSLTNACIQQDIDVVDAHDAIGDCRMTLELVKRMAEAV